MIRRSYRFSGGITWIRFKEICSKRTSGKLGRTSTTEQARDTSQNIARYETLAASSTQYRHQTGRVLFSPPPLRGHSTKTFSVGWRDAPVASDSNAYTRVKKPRSLQQQLCNFCCTSPKVLVSTASRGGHRPRRGHAPIVFTSSRWRLIDISSLNRYRYNQRCRYACVHKHTTHTYCMQAASTSCQAHRRQAPILMRQQPQKKKRRRHLERCHHREGRGWEKREGGSSSSTNSIRLIKTPTTGGRDPLWGARSFRRS